MIYIPSRNAHSVLRLAKPDPKLDSNLLYMQTPGRNPQMPDGLPLFKPPYTRITAIDMNSGNHAWMVPAGAGDRIRNHPRLKGLNLPPVGGDSNFSGPLLTKTLLIYALTAGGSTGGPRLVAYDKATGKELASADLPGAAVGTPMTYLVGGKQFIAITVQGRTATDVPELIALALPPS
jgi:quinoprotein glucose dehydrogenase